MTDRSAPFLAWPGWKHLRFAWLLSSAGLLWFILVYYGADAVTAHRSFRVRVHFDAELGIPFVPDAVILYMSIYPLFFAAPFVLRERRDFVALAITLNGMILVAGFCFLLLPAQVAFHPVTDLGAFPNLFRFADRVSLNYNLLPSLHVALSAACVAVFATRADWPGKMLLWTWALAIAASTLLTHKHHVLDVVAGFVLAWAGIKFIYARLSKSPAT